MVLAAGLLIVCATVLLAAGSVYGEVVALGGLRQAILEAPPASRVVLVGSTATSSDVDAIDEVVSREALEVLGSAGGEVGFVIRSGGFVRAGSDPDDPGGLTRLGSYRGIDAHAALIEGSWPVAGSTPLEAALSEGAAASLGAGLGDRIELVSRDDPGVTAQVSITGIWRPNRDDPYWIGSALELDGTETRGPFTTTGPIVVDREDLVRRVESRALELEWRAIPDIEALQIGGLELLRRDIETLDDRLTDARLRGRSLRVESELPGILETVARRTLVSRSGVMLLTIQFAILAAYAIILVAGMLIERRRVEGALLRSRGASTLHLAGMAFGEAVLLAIPAALIAPWLAVGVVQVLGMVGPLAEAGIANTATVDSGVMVVAAVTAAACVVALTLPSFTSGGTPAGVRARLSRQIGRTLAQRLGIDLVLVVLAGIGLWQLRLYGSPLTQNARGTLGLDPLLVAAPGIGLLAGGVVATRIVPRLAEIAERILSRRRGLVAPIGARQLARRPLRYTRSALLLMLAVALGTFAASDAATWTASQEDQATYQAAADLRVVVPEYTDLPGWVIGPAIRSVDGVRGATPIVRMPLDVGRAIRGGDVLAFDPAVAPGLVHFPDEDAAARLPGLLAGLTDSRPATRAVALAGAPQRLSIVLDAGLHNDLETVSDASIPEDWAGIDVSAVVEDGDGRLHRLTGSPGLFVGAGQRIELPLTQVIGGVRVGVPGPISLQGVELNFRVPAEDPPPVAVGTVDIRSVEASASVDGADWTDVGWAPNAPGWTWTIRYAFDTSDRAYRPPPGAPSQIVFDFGDGKAEPLFGGSSAVFRSSTVPADADLIPAVVSDQFLELSGAAIGDEVAASIAGQRVELEVVASTAEFPSLDPTEGFAIVDATTLERSRLATTGQVLITEEWWLGVDDGRAAAVEEALRGAPLAAVDVIGRASLTRSLASDPISLGIIGALGLGALAALAFASIGFIVSATVSTSERVTEFAILRALGLSARELSAWVSLENAFLLVFGLVAGSFLGILLAWLVLPFATLTETGAVAVPSPEVVVPLEAIAPLYLAALVLFAVTVVIVTRQVRRAGITTVLRSGEE